MKNTQELLNILTLDDLGEGNFNGVSRDIGSPNVFGGQVLAQALNAAYRTTPKERILHSLHSYFLEAGNLELPITYNVQTIRDGGSFSKLGGTHANRATTKTRMHLTARRARQT